jgi:hypothetical protein
MAKPRQKHKRPSAAEMEERVSVPLTPDELAKGLLQAGPHPEIEDEARQEREYPADETDEG